MEIEDVTDLRGEETGVSAQEVYPLAAACVQGAEIAIREWLAYDSLINERVFDVRYVECASSRNSP